MKKDFNYFNIIFLILLVLSCLNVPTFVRNENYNYVLDTSYITKVDVVFEEELPEEISKEDKVLDVFYGSITSYVSYCEGCIGITASGYDVRNTIYYEDNEYGIVRIIAADPSLPFGTIIKISNIGKDITTIVLDRGGSIGFNNFSQADLLSENLSISYEFGKKNNAKFEILRYGF